MPDATETSRNYNLNRVLDSKTKEFEKKLELLLVEYDVNMETETFPGETE